MPAQIQTQVTVMRTAMDVAEQLGVKRMVQIVCGMARRGPGSLEL
jgi:hypothetical protein